jgi:hypothetical protein
MIFLTDPKFDMRQNSLDNTFLSRMLEPTNVLMLVTDSTKEDVESISRSIPIYCRLKRGLIIFIIANMQDNPNVLTVDEIKAQTGIGDVLGIVAINPNTKLELESFFEESVLRYFHLLERRGQTLELVGDKDFAQSVNTTDTRPTKREKKLSESKDSEN